MSGINLVDYDTYLYVLPGVLVGLEKAYLLPGVFLQYPLVLSSQVLCRIEWQAEGDPSSFKNIYFRQRSGRRLTAVVELFT